MSGKSLNYYLFLPGIVLSLILQFTFIPQILPESLVFNAALLVIIAASFLSTDSNLLYAAFFTGYVIDIFSGKYFGAVIMSFLITAVIALYISRYLIKELHLPVMVLYSVLLVMAYNISYFAISYLMNSYVPAIDISDVVSAIMADALFLVITIYPMIFLFSLNKNEK